MAMRHKMIPPKKHKASKAKRRGAGQHHVNLASNQVEAIDTWVKDFRQQLPLIRESAAAAQRVFHELMDADTWQVAEGERPQGVSMLEQQPKLFSVGHAKVNYVDHIERQGDSQND